MGWLVNDRWYLAIALATASSACMFAADFDDLGPAATPRDAGTATHDASDAKLDASAPLRCPEGAALCDDFERSELQGRWTSSRVSDGAELVLAPVLGLGRGLRATLTASGLPSADDRLALLAFEPSSDAGVVPVARLRIALQVAFEDAPQAAVRLLEVRLGAGSVKLVCHPDGRFEAVGADSMYFTQSPSRGRRQRIELDAYARGSVPGAGEAGGYAAYLYDFSQQTRTMVASGVAALQRGAAEVRLGLAESASPSGWSASFDDVVVVVDPGDSDAGI